MPSTKAIKQRIKSVKNTSQITKAMEVVSATKMRRSQGFALRARPYAMAGLEMLQNLIVRTAEELMPALLKPRAVKKSLLVVVTSDKGLAGAFNANVIRKADLWITEKESAKLPYALIAVGKKAKDYYERRGKNVIESFVKFGDYSALEQTLPVADQAINGFLDSSWDAVDVCYTNFRTTLMQEALIKRILPATREGLDDAVKGMLPERGRFAEGVSKPYTLNPTPYHYEYQFEPSPAAILNTLVPQLIRMHIHHVILESNASEHSARMVAMKSASDNARELITGLTLAFNKARQAGITRELTEITAGKEALEI